ncbi:hypothetical protein IWQ47_003426 [Aquimarina sp. EL_43]|uniref:hypothetical protein n=1 Tax=unclassified Aquimarina TaxID=2627091 RepID=UPI0018CA8A13|nr:MULTISPECIES: hypothetical protein [unclassified Aquimarina]MBG6131832.1 hypothetical protein [Aquimarina sp. EL_35]MBG6149396.1 hypothetical protein [Aquimarina sp. EL_32]MBG6170341.1 hypothetical protein [Aquimarina sp. EL_43]
MKRILKIIVFSVLILFAGFWVWYEYTYSMDTVIPFEVNDANLETKVLIASQGSRFKDSLVQGIIRHYQNDVVYFKIIDVYTMFTVDIDKWDALVIINSWEYGSPPRNVKKFIKNHPSQLDKLIILSTVGSSNIALEDVDVISGESIIEKAPEYTSIVVERLDKIIKPKTLHKF